MIQIYQTEVECVLAMDNINVGGLGALAMCVEITNDRDGFPEKMRILTPEGKVSIDRWELNPTPE